METNKYQNQLRKIADRPKTIEQVMISRTLSCNSSYGDKTVPQRNMTAPGKIDKKKEDKIVEKKDEKMIVENKEGLISRTLARDILLKKEKLAFQSPLSSSSTSVTSLSSSTASINALPDKNENSIILQEQKITKLKENCLILADRVRLMEKLLEENGITIESSFYRSKSRKSNKIIGMSETVKDISTTIKRLDHLYHAKPSAAQEILIASEIINKSIRSFLIKQRYKKFYQALGNWRSRYSPILINSIQIYIKRQYTLFNGIKSFQLNKINKINVNILKKWHLFALSKQPLFKKASITAEKLFNDKRINLLKEILKKWSEIANGKRSRKMFIKRYKEELSFARERLVLSNRYSLITQEMTHKEVKKERFRRIRYQHCLHVLKTYYFIWKEDIYISYKQNQDKAIKYFYITSLKKNFLGWMFSFKNRDKENGGKEEYDGIKYFPKRYNKRKVIIFTETRITKRIFTYWKEYFLKGKKIQKLWEKRRKEQLLTLVLKWKEQAKYQHEIRKLTIQDWIEYGKKLYDMYFKSWYIYSIERKSKHLLHEKLILANVKRQKKRIMYSIFVSWRYYMMFGQVEGLQTRINLLTNLEEQKSYSNVLEENIKQYKQQIDEMQKIIKEECETSLRKQAQAEEMHRNSQDLRFALHNAEQEIFLLQSILEYIRKLHPVTVSRILSIYNENKGNYKALEQIIAVNQEQISTKSLLASKDEIELLERVRWAFNCFDLKAEKEGQERSKVIEQEKGEESESVEKDLNISQEAIQMYALLEYMKTGDASGLMEVNRPAIQRNLPSNLAIVNKHTSTSSYSNKITRVDLIQQTPTWNDFVLEMTAQLPLGPTASIRDRLKRRIAFDGMEAKTLAYNSLKNTVEPFNIYKESLKDQ